MKDVQSRNGLFKSKSRILTWEDRVCFLKRQALFLLP